MWLFLRIYMTGEHYYLNDTYCMNDSILRFRLKLPIRYCSILPPKPI